MSDIVVLILCAGAAAIGFAMIWRAIRRAETVDDDEFTGEFFGGRDL